MNLLEALRSRPGTVVLVDNEFAPRQLDHVNEVDRTNFFNLLADEGAIRRRVSAFLRIEGAPSPEDIMKVVDASLGQLWDQYIANPQAHADWDTLFITEKANYLGDRYRLEVLVKFCTETLGVEPVIHHDLAEAKNALRTCMIAFIDLYLKAGLNNLPGAIEEHGGHMEAYRAGFEHNEKQWPKVVFLVSSKLPAPEHLQLFRAATGIRAAFFRGMSKGAVSDAALAEMIEPWRSTYGASAMLNQYLNELCRGVEEAGAAVKNEVDRLELHDLTMLDALRLSAEPESLQSYLTWICSEALASKLRTTKSLQTAMLPDPNDMPTLDGQLLPKSVLFEMFAEVAISASSAGLHGPEFGDIYAAVPEAAEGPQALLLAISPACDLARCAAEYQVLCVNGKLTKADNHLAELLGKKALYGGGKHVIRFRQDERYGYIEWTLKKGLITHPVSALKDQQRFKKIARLSEVFAQEIKELALSDVSRVGTPVEPTFAVEAGVIVRAKFNLQQQAGGPKPDPLKLQVDLQDKSFISAVLTKGRLTSEQGLPEVIVFTHQFRNWMLKEFLPQLRGEQLAPTKLKSVEDNLAGRPHWHVPLTDNHSAKELNGNLRYEVVEPGKELEEIKGDGVEILVAVKMSR